MKLKFNTNGNDKQKQVCKYWLDKITTEIVYGGSKGSGKSYLLASLIFGDALIYPETYYFIARKKLNDLRRFTIPTIHEVLSNWNLHNGYYNYNGQDNFYTLYNKSRVYLLDAKYIPSDPMYERFGSMQMTRGAIEEAGEFESECKENLQASIGRWKNDTYNLTPKLLQTCNPSKNYLYKDYKKNKAGVLEEHKKFVQAYPQDNKMLPDGYLLNLEKTLSGNQKQRLLHGNWEYDDDPSALINYEAIQNSFTNSFVKDGDRYITADIARFGRDKTVVGVWSGFRLIKVIEMDKNLINQAASAIDALSKQYSVPRSRIAIDEDGVGGGVVDLLRGCRGIVNNSSPIDENGVKQNYTNLKSQLYFKLADSINSNKYYFCIDNDKTRELITQELEQVKQKDFDKDGKRAVISKDVIKSLIGRSPDYSDMIMLREYFEIKQGRIKSIGIG